MAEQRLIDANALIPKLKFIREGEDQIYGISSFDFSGKCITAVEDAPTIEERKKGKWVKISPSGIYECSVCGQNVMTQDIDVYLYCHGCGAVMGVRHETNVYINIP